MPLRLFKEKDVIIALVTTIAIFMVDLLVPLWNNVWVLYLVPMFFAFRTAMRPYVYSVTISALITAGMFLPHSNKTLLVHSPVNRFTGILGVWGVSVLLMRLRHLHSSLLLAHSELEKRIEEKTYALFQANRSLEEDIAYRKKIEEALQESEERYRLLFCKTPIGIFNYDEQLILTAYNDHFMEILVHSDANLLGLDMKTLKDQSIMPALRKATEGEEGGYEGFYETADFGKIWIAIRTAPIFTRDGEVSSCVGIVQDITQRKKMEDDLRSLSLTDELTGLYNRRGFFSFCDKVLKLSDRQNKGACLLYADLDNLKEINDLFGHQEGDKMLVDTADIFKETFRGSDIIARVGGDEFVVLPIGSTKDAAPVIVARLLHNIERCNAEKDGKYALSLSFGTSYYDPQSPCSIGDLVAEAEKIMYVQKKEKKLMS
jgi:diguanylate cyclase (GGDEF)-like protein/PAS domain S-box-containing protein